MSLFTSRLWGLRILQRFCDDHWASACPSIVPGLNRGTMGSGQALSEEYSYW